MISMLTPVNPFEWVATHTVAPMTQSPEGTRVPSAAPRYTATTCTVIALDGTFVGSPAWSPPV